MHRQLVASVPRILHEGGVAHVPHLLLHVELGQQVGSSLWIRLRVDLTLVVVVDVFDVADP